jgi:hypothetical protein
VVCCGRRSGLLPRAKRRSGFLPGSRPDPRGRRPRRRRAVRPPRGRRRRTAAATPGTSPDRRLLRRRHPRSARHLHLHHLQLPPPPSPGSSACSRGAHPALLGPCALQRRLCTLSVGLLPASCVAGDVVAAPFASSRTTTACLPALPICARLSCSPMAGCGCGFELGCRKPGSRLKSRKIESGLLPRFQVALLAP